MGVSAKKSVKLDDLPVEERSAFESLLEKAAKTKSEEVAKTDLSSASPPPNTEGVGDGVAERGGLLPMQTPIQTQIEPPTGGDMCSYIIKTKVDGKVVTLKFDDTSLPENMHHIFQKYLDQE